MGQQSWSFTDYFGTEHNFGIYHGEESGHLVCYLDNSIMHMKKIKPKALNSTYTKIEKLKNFLLGRKEP